MNGRLRRLLPAVAAAVVFCSEMTAAAENYLRADLSPELAVDFVDPRRAEKSATFADGERLRFKLGWSLFTVARAELETMPGKHRGREALRIRLQARTNAFADAFYKVRNQSVSWISRDVSASFLYAAQQSEGGDDRNTRAVFDPEELTAYYENLLKDEVRDPVAILPGTFDPLGIVFFVRALDFEVGDRLVIPTSNGKEFFFTVVHVVDRVKRRFASGKQEAFVLEPDIKDLGGVFKRSPGGYLRFFFSTDDRKLPLRMESKVAVGRFWAELTEIEEP
ncbi:MAG: DUF3108 domain-containing protein [Verrucomicrobia bacterium]|nr:DUF3108 domain-containing protein [Verrucomicrobiota bacterium]